MTTEIKELISRKNKLYSRIKRRNNGFLDKQLLHSLQQHLSKSTENAKNKYFFRISEKLKNPNASTKCYWSLIKTLLNGKTIPCVPPIHDNNRCVTGFKEMSTFQFLLFRTMYYIEKYEYFAQYMF